MMDKMDHSFNSGGLLFSKAVFLEVWSWAQQQQYPLGTC